MEKIGNQNLRTLWRDFDVPPQPNWRDPMTMQTLDRIVEDIRLHRLSYNEFYQFVTDKFGTGDFAWGCLHYVRGKVTM